MSELLLLLSMSPITLSLSLSRCLLIRKVFLSNALAVQLKSPSFSLSPLISQIIVSPGLLCIRSEEKERGWLRMVVPVPVGFARQPPIKGERESKGMMLLSFLLPCLGTHFLIDDDAQKERREETHLECSVTLHSRTLGPHSFSFLFSFVVS